MTACPSCGAALDVADARCPACKAPSRGDLARGGAGDLLARSADEAAFRDQLGARLAKSASLDQLARVETLSAALNVADLDDERDRASNMLVRELEDALPNLSTVDLGELRLAKLVDPTADAKIFRNGFAFLKRKRYAEAAEWWSLQSDAAEETKPRLALLLLVLLLVTHELAGDKDRAAAVRRRIAEHPAYATARGIRRG